MLPAHTVIAETQSERDVELSFLHTETGVVVACTIQHKNINATGVFSLIHEFKMTPSFSNAEIGKNLVYLGKYGSLLNVICCKCN
jgi:hypothetical protein